MKSKIKDAIRAISRIDFNRKQHSYLPDLAEKLAGGEISRRQFLRTATLVGVSAAAAYSAAGILDGAVVTEALAQETPRRGGTLTIGMRVLDASDPALADGFEKANIFRHTLETLTETGSDNITRPLLAESWTASDDLKEWTFKLRQNVKWSNGDAFTAEDVAFNFKRWLRKELGSANLSLFTGLTPENVIVADAHTITLKFSAPILTVPENLNNYTTFIVHPTFDETGANITREPIGTGAYGISEFMLGESCRLDRRAEYWGEGAYLDTIRYVDLGDDVSAQAAALASGQVDGLFEVDVSQVSLFQALPGIVLSEKPSATTAVARMQVTQAPFDDKRVRKAVQLSVDRQQILERAYDGRGVVGEDHHVCPIHPDYTALPPLVRNVEEAKRLLAEAGHPDGITITITCRSAPQWELNAMQILVEQLKESGITLNLNVVPTSVFWEGWMKVPMNFSPWGHRPFGVMVLNLGYTSNGPWNESKHSNPDFDAAVAKANGILDPVERAKHLAIAQKILQDDAVIIQPLWRSVFAPIRENVRGFEVHQTFNHLFRNVWLAEA